MLRDNNTREAFNDWDYFGGDRNVTKDLIIGLVVGFILGVITVVGLYFYLLLIYEPPSLVRMKKLAPHKERR